MRYSVKSQKLNQTWRHSKQGKADVMAMLSGVKLRSKSRRRRALLGLIGGNLLLLLIVSIFVISNRYASQTVRSSTIHGTVATARSQANPLDQLSSAQIALQAAQMTNLPELTMVRNRADSEAALLNVVPNDTTALAKPQIVATAEKSRHNIIHYKSVAGDTIGSLAAKYGISANSIRWSNNLTGDALAAGTNLLIPPAEGIVYQVKAGDTIASITNKYQANKDTFIVVNDAENGSLPVGEYVWVPNGLPPVPVARFATPNFGSFSISNGFYYSGPCIQNGYDCGWCTWWSAYRRSQIGHPVPPNLGDAYSWARIATLDGLAVGLRPQAGAVIWFPGADHVGFVESIGADGSVYVSEMHVIGYNMVTYRTIPAAQAGNYKYIY